MRFLILLLLITTCGAKKNEYDSFGEVITNRGAIDTETLINEIDDQSQTFKVKGKIEAVCQKRGCWLTLKNDRNVNIQVTFKDYGFFIPKDVTGNEVIIKGTASKELLEEDLAKHYANDSGAPYDTTMRSVITFIADGILVSKS
ncbi:MAG: DUF4920 domain-containing protein [Bacteroidota bacterium]